jgi:uncharacterized paraquat-inducible protein A
MMSDEIVRLRWHCDVCEPDDCDSCFETISLGEEWDDKTASATCPRCGAELWMPEDYPKLVGVDDE